MYSSKTGLWKALKNVVIVLTPAAAAGYAAFVANVPAEYQGAIAAIASFVVYFVKNWYVNRDK